MRNLAAVYRALADETRLEMLGLLFTHGELCVCDFSGMLAINQSNASRHLQHLKHAGLVVDRPAAVWVYYAVRSDLDPQRKTVLAALRRQLQEHDRTAIEARFVRWQAQKARYGAACRIPVRPRRAAPRIAKEARP